jgi:hypothetical protein
MRTAIAVLISALALLGAELVWAQERGGTPDEAPGSFTVRGDFHACDGVPTYDVECHGVKGDGNTDDTAAFQAAVDSYNLCRHGERGYFHTGNRAYRVTRTITIDVGVGCWNSDGFKWLTDGGTDLDGIAITDAPTLKILCTGRPSGCNNFRLSGRLTVKGSNQRGPVIQLGASDNSDALVGDEIDYLIAQNFASSGNPAGIEVNSVRGSNLNLFTFCPNPPLISDGYGIKLNGAQRNWGTVSAGCHRNGGNGDAAWWITGETQGNSFFRGSHAGNTCFKIDSPRSHNNSWYDFMFGGCNFAFNATAGANNRFVNANGVGLSGIGPAVVGVDAGLGWADLIAWAPRIAAAGGTYRFTPAAVEAHWSYSDGMAFFDVGWNQTGSAGSGATALTITLPFTAKYESMVEGAGPFKMTCSTAGPAKNTIKCVKYDGTSPLQDNARYHVTGYIPYASIP